MEHAGGLSWVIDEPMQRASHALLHAGRVWLIDPVDDPETIERTRALGEPAAVVQLLDRHNRDCAAVARQLGVALHRVPDSLPGSPFEVVPVLRWRRWREVALHWRERETLVVAEAVGTAPLFTLGRGTVGVHPVLRLTPSRVLESVAPQLLLVGHGSPLQKHAAEGLRGALARSRSDIPRLLFSLPGAIRQRV